MKKCGVSEDEYGTGGKGFTIDGQKISIWYDNDGIRIRRGDSARRNFDRMVRGKKQRTEFGICMRMEITWII